MKIAIIPAREGSKRIAKKNIKFFHGKPIIAYSIEAAIASKCFDKVIVSTESAEIARCAILYGAEVPFLRPAALADDYTTTKEVIAHAIEWCLEQGWQIETVCCLYSTAPFITAEILQQTYQAFIHSEAEYLFSAVKFDFPIQRAFSFNEKEQIALCDPEHENSRSQDLPETYHDAGQFYWGKPSAFLANKSFFASSSRAFILPRALAYDIDTPDDWHFAEQLFALTHADKKTI